MNENDKPGLDSRELPGPSWTEIAEAFDTVIELEDPAAMKEQIAELGRRNPSMLPHWRSLLESLGDDQFLAHPCSVVLSEFLAREDPGESREWVGRTLGRWKLEERVGSGGMGVVFRARRADGEFEQKAAVKILASNHPGFSDRFVMERQILARLEHPNIARLIDGGVDEEGTPFLVAEFIDGQRIDQWADVHHLDLRRRLELFCDVCGAVDYAHRNLVIHRDIKPANVLVTSEGTVKLVDFGVARLLESSGEGHGDDKAPLTLGYAAPEQWVGEPVTTTADVFALGCLLSRLLTGQSPWEDRAEEDPASLLDRMREGRGRLPSALAVHGANKGIRASDLRGDLDAVVRHCLRPDPEDRYPSPSALAEDIRRHLTRWPVKARSARRSYRLGRFLLRNRGAVVATLLTVILLLVGTGSLLNRAQAAEARQRRAEQVMSFVQEVLRPEALSAPNSHPATVLETGVATARRRFADEPEIEASVLETLGEMLYKLEAHGPAEQALQRALELRKKSGDIEAVVEGLSSLAWAKSAAGDIDRGLELMDEALTVAENQGGRYHLARAHALHHSGFFEVRVLGPNHPRHPESLNRLREALEIYEGHHPDQRERIARTVFFMGLATVDPIESLNLQEKGVELMRQTKFKGEPEFAYALGDLALMYERTGRIDQAVKQAQEAVDLMTDLRGQGDVERLRLQNNLAGILRDAGRFREAEPLYREVLEGRRRLMPDDAGAIAFPLYGLGRVQLGLGRYEEAESHLRQALALVESQEWWQRSVAVRLTLGECLAARGSLDEGEGLIRELAVELEDRLPTSSELEKARVLLRQFAEAKSLERPV